MQELWLTVHRRLSDFEGRSSYRTWLFGIALNIARQLRRNQRRAPERTPVTEALPSQAPGPDRVQPGGEAPAAPPPRPRPELRTAFDGHWIGEASDPFASGATYRFPSGSTQIQLQLSAGSGRSGDSRITFGAGPAPAPATDGDVGYPLGTSFDPNLPGFGDRSIAPPTEGFAYALADVPPGSRDVGVAMGPIGSELEIGRSINPDNLLTDGRADYSFFPAEVYGSWCALQTPASCDDSVDVEEGSCSLLPSGAPDLAVDCHKASLCSRQLCSCPADGSRASCASSVPTAKRRVTAGWRRRGGGLAAPTTRGRGARSAL